MKFATATGHDVSHFFVPVSLDQCDRHSSEIARAIVYCKEAAAAAAAAAPAAAAAAASALLESQVS